MIRLCKKRKIDLVLCKSISRFARNTVDTLEYVRQLKDLGIGVIFEKENINPLTMTSEFMIAQHLNALNIPKREYTEWNINGIHSILSNEKYAGDALLQKTYTVDCITHKKAKNKGERAKYLVTDAHDAIIDRDTYNLAQQELARRS